MRLATAFVALLTSTAVGASSDAARVPDQYIGQWAGSPEACGSDADADDLTLRLSKDRIAYWESEGSILASVSRGGRELALIMELSGEGETWLATAKFELSADGQQLVDTTTIPGEAVVRHRCQAVVAARPNYSFQPAPSARLNLGVSRMWNAIGGMLLISASTSAAEMTRVERDAGYCAGNKETYCFEWTIPSLGNLHFIAHGDEDVIEYGFYRLGVDGYGKLSDVLPVLEDASRPGQLFWGYPWDIAAIKLTRSGERAALLGTFDHQLTSTDADGVSVNLSGKQAILFVGRTTQPEASVAPLQFHAVAPSELGPAAN